MEVAELFNVRNSIILLFHNKIVYTVLQLLSTLQTSITHVLAQKNIFCTEKRRGIARTQIPSTKNYMPHLSLFGT